MRSMILLIAAFGIAVSLSSCATRATVNAASVPVYHVSSAPLPAPSAAAVNQTNVAWPVVFSRDSTTYTVFEPQSDSWNGHQLAARSAVAVQPNGQSQDIYGVISFNAVTLVDKTSRTATLADIKVKGADFPSAPGESQHYTATLRQEFPKHAEAVSLDLLETSLTTAEERPKPESLNNTPPKIFTDTRPAVLVYIDGPPVWRPVSSTDLERVINTRMLLLKDEAGRYYLHLFDGYLEASSLHGPWAVAAHGPAGADTAEAQATSSGQVDLLRGEVDSLTQKAPSLTTTLTPDVFVATTPSELITFNGEPDYIPIQGTDLLYAANTTGNVFKSLADQQNYVLISGRWYRAHSLSGPWQFVPGSQLPQDFANIPDTSPKENVKASVPSTPQAEEALIANSIPQSTAVARNDKMQDPQFDGAPQVAPIQGTPLNYVVNSGTPIIEVDSHSWYACQNGVWYAGTSADGPWRVAASVPAVIYTIPTTSPLHYVTYVRVYDSTPDVVYEGYTPGYFGTEVSDDDTVVYGTGYWYPPWVGGVWFGPPITWGCGFADCWTPWWGWDFNCGFGWGFGGFGWWGCHPPFPWWGGFRAWHDHDWHEWRGRDHGFVANTGANIYHHGPFGGLDRRGQFAATGFRGADRLNRPVWGRNFGAAYNSRTGRLASGQQARVGSVYGSAWRPLNRPAVTRNNTYSARGPVFEVNRSRGWANGSSSFGHARQFSPSGSWAWSAPRQSYSRAPGGSVRSFGGWNHAGASPWYGGNTRSFPSRSFGGWQGGSRSFSQGAGSFRNFGGISHGGGWGGFHGGGGGFHGGGGGFHGGGGGGGRGGGGRR